MLLHGKYVRFWRKLNRLHLIFRRTQIAANHLHTCVDAQVSRVLLIRLVIKFLRQTDLAHVHAIFLTTIVLKLHRY